MTPAMDPTDLYGLPLDRFTPERNALARELRQRGERDRAAEVAKLRKPSVAAWAVNQLVRTQQRDVEALFAAGDALQAAQADVVAGRGDARSLWSAAETERAALAGLTKKAGGLLSPEGHELAPAKLEQVSDTLHAAAIDADAREQLRDGCLVRELQHVGLGALGAAGGGDAPAPPARTARAKPPADDRAADRKAAERSAARQVEAAARREHELAARAVEAAQERRDRADEALTEAEESLSAARERAERAAQELERSRKALESL